MVPSSPAYSPSQDSLYLQNKIPAPQHGPRASVTCLPQLKPLSLCLSRGLGDFAVSITQLASFSELPQPVLSDWGSVSSIPPISPIHRVLPASPCPRRAFAAPPGKVKSSLHSLTAPRSSFLGTVVEAFIADPVQCVQMIITYF